MVVHQNDFEKVARIPARFDTVQATVEVVGCVNEANDDGDALTHTGDAANGRPALRDLAGIAKVKSTILGGTPTDPVSTILFQGSTSFS